MGNVIYTQLDLDWKINISCNSIQCFNLQLMRQSRYDMNLKIFGVNFSQFSMDLPTANIIKSPLCSYHSECLFTGKFHKLYFKHV